MDKFEAEKAIESLRFGTPPEGHVLEFTVGRESEIGTLTARLKAEGATPRRKSSRALLINANWGSGKSHLLQVVREVALKNSFAISLIEVDSRAGVRFNRMDTIFGAVCRDLETPPSAWTRPRSSPRSQPEPARDKTQDAPISWHRCRPKARPGSNGAWSEFRAPSMAVDRAGILPLQSPIG